MTSHENNYCLFIFIIFFWGEGSPPCYFYRYVAPSLIAVNIACIGETKHRKVRQTVGKRRISRLASSGRVGFTNCGRSGSVCVKATRRKKRNLRNESPSKSFGAIGWHCNWNSSTLGFLACFFLLLVGYLMTLPLTDVIVAFIIFIIIFMYLLYDIFDEMMVMIIITK